MHRCTASTYMCVFKVIELDGNSLTVDNLMKIGCGELKVEVSSQYTYSDHTPSLPPSPPSHSLCVCSCLILHGMLSRGPDWWWRSYWPPIKVIYALHLINLN